MMINEPIYLEADHPDGFKQEIGIVYDPARRAYGVSIDWTYLDRVQNVPELNWEDVELPLDNDAFASTASLLSVNLISVCGEYPQAFPVRIGGELCSKIFEKWVISGWNPAIGIDVVKGFSALLFAKSETEVFQLAPSDPDSVEETSQILGTDVRDVYLSAYSQALGDFREWYRRR